MKSIVVLGDSILAGVIYDDINAKYDNIGDNNAIIIADKYRINIINKSIFGLTTTKVLQRKMHTKYCNIDNINCDIMLIELGGNDCDFDWVSISKTPHDDHFPKTQLSTFKNNLECIISDLKKINVQPIIATLTPIIATKYFDWVTRNCDSDNVMIWLKSVQRIYMWQELYSNTVREVANEHSIPLIDNRKNFLMQKDLNDFMCEDGIHLNIDGHNLLTQGIISFIEDNKTLLL